MATKKKLQISMDDRIVQNNDLNQLLEQRETLKVGVSEYRQVDKKTKEFITKLKEVLPFRIGRFIISETKREAKSVAFDVDASCSIRISALEE